MNLVYIILIGYTIIWFAIWWTVLRHKSKENDYLCEELDKLESEYNTLKDDYNKLEGRYDELLRVVRPRDSNNTQTLADQGYLPN